MAKPHPKAGLVIRYDYLWALEDSRGYADGDKDRPCAVVITLPATDEQPLRAMVCGITHSQPRSEAEAVEIPLRVKKMLGLDNKRSWAILDEVNIIDWDDAGIIQTPSGQWSYGMLPRELMEEIKAKAIENSRTGDLEMVKRDKRPAAE
jgi:hypothetical protein